MTQGMLVLNLGRNERMGCKHACTCGGFCPGCTSFEPEEYCGEAEDNYDMLYGSPQQPEQEDPRMQEHEEEMIRQHNLKENQNAR